jgi:hypothetical protein
MQQLAPRQDDAEVPINENFETLQWASIFGKRHPGTSGLVWAYYGGVWGGSAIADGDIETTWSSTG